MPRDSLVVHMNCIHFHTTPLSFPHVCLLRPHPYSRRHPTKVPAVLACPNNGDGNGEGEGEGDARAGL
jgi:hypothetical protein